MLRQNKWDYVIEIQTGDNKVLYNFVGMEFRSGLAFQIYPQCGFDKQNNPKFGYMHIGYFTIGRSWELDYDNEESVKQWITDHVEDIMNVLSMDSGYRKNVIEKN